MVIKIDEDKLLQALEQVGSLTLLAHSNHIAQVSGAPMVKMSPEAAAQVMATDKKFAQAVRMGARMYLNAIRKVANDDS